MRRTSAPLLSVPKTPSSAALLSESLSSSTSTAKRLPLDDGAARAFSALPALWEVPPLCTTVHSGTCGDVGGTSATIVSAAPRVTKTPPSGAGSADAAGGARIAPRRPRLRRDLASLRRKRAPAPPRPAPADPIGAADPAATSSLLPCPPAAPTIAASVPT